MNTQEEKKYKAWSKLVLVGLLLLSGFFANRALYLKFDYDFEKFFPKQNDDLSFYENFRNTFENDNDFIIIGLRNEEGIFHQKFLESVSEFVNDLKELPHYRGLVNPLDQVYFKTNSNGIGLKAVPYFHWDEPSKYQSDSIRIFSGKDPIMQFISADKKSMIILFKNVQMISKVKSDELAVAMEKLLEEQDFDEVHAMGKILGQKAYIEIMQWEFLTFMAFVIGVLVLFLIITYRSVWGVFIPLLTVSIAVLGSLGIMQLSGTPLNMMTTLLPVIMLVVGMSDVVHLVSKYLEEIRLGNDKITSIKNMLKKVGTATLLTSLTTALGFITLIGVSMEPVRDFGIFTAIGVLLAFVLSILFIPSIFMLIKTKKILKPQSRGSNWDRFLASSFVLLCRNRKKVLMFYALLTILALIGASRVQFDYFLMQDLGEDNKIMKEVRFFQDEFGGLRPFEMALIAKGENKINEHELMLEIAKLEEYAKELYDLTQVISPTSAYKMLNRALRNDKDQFYVIPNREKRFNYLDEQIEVFKEQEEFQLIIDEEGKLGRLSAKLIDPGSRAMLLKSDSLRLFYEKEINQNVLDYRLTGTTVIIDESGRYVSKNIILGLFVAFFIIAISMGILFKSLKMAFLSLVPNLFPIVLTAGFIGFAGIDLNMTTAIVFTIAFGIAVDDTIHFLSRYRQEIILGKSNLLSLRRTFISTGKAIIITSIILLGGFASLLFSDFLSTFYIGLFVSMTLLFAVITDLTLLPVLLLKKK